jgi:hypothetical protein
VGHPCPISRAAWDKMLAQTASALGAGLKEFLTAWRADYATRAAGELEASLRRVCQQAGVVPDDARIRGALEIRRTALTGMFLPRPDAAPTLRQVRAREYRLGLLTNCTSEIPQLWQRSPLMDATVFSCAEGLRMPALAIYDLAASRLGVDTSDCVLWATARIPNSMARPPRACTPSSCARVTPLRPKPGTGQPFIGSATFSRCSSNSRCRRQPDEAQRSPGQRSWPSGSIQNRPTGAICARGITAVPLVRSPEFQTRKPPSMVPHGSGCFAPARRVMRSVGSRACTGRGLT